MTISYTYRSRRRLLCIIQSLVLVFGSAWLVAGGAGVSAQAETIVVRNTNNRGEGSLRRAINDANARTGPNTIRFAIPGTGPHTIQLEEPLPTLTDDSGGTTIDGYTQQGATPNTDALASNAKIMVQIRGEGAEETDTIDPFQGLLIESSNNVIRGLAFFNLQRALHIAVSPPANAPVTNNQIIGNFIGINAAGETTYTERGWDTEAYGIFIRNGATNTVIGTTAPADRNVISGNAQDGIFIVDLGTNGTRIVNNIMGLDPSGTRRVRNWGDAIDLNFGVQNTVIGGSQQGERNVISGNQGEGIEISHNITTRNNTVAGNFIGTDLTGKNSAPDVTFNHGFGISLEDRVTGNTIGPGNVIANNRKGGVYVSGILDNPTPGLVGGQAAEPQQVDAASGDRIVGNRIGLDVDGAPAGNGFGDEQVERGDGIWLNTNTRNTIIEENIIGHNAGAGVRIVGFNTDFNRVSRNSFRSNGGLAIDIAPAGPNGTSACTGQGPNQCIQAPVLTTAEAGRVAGTACANCTVELYLSAQGADAEGEEFVLAVTAGADGRWEAALPSSAANRVPTATATDAQGNTSEFSLSSNGSSTIYLPLVMVTRGGR
ncbi:MAG TPA: hypothetical protein VLA19_10630 [Herpetosiphonaceae bacterium]|nr:hypothetical protein [Herpetosiphonaceae bacterium]